MYQSSSNALHVLMPFDTPDNYGIRILISLFLIEEENGTQN